jgi:hypothetical protein
LIGYTCVLVLFCQLAGHAYAWLGWEPLVEWGIGMANYTAWVNRHKYRLHSLALILMVLPPVGMYLAAQAGAVIWIWVLLAFVVAGNLLAITRALKR